MKNLSERAAPCLAPAAPQDQILAVSVTRFSDLTGFGRTFLYDEIKRGNLKLTKKGRRSCILLDDGKAWLRGSN